MASPIEMPKPGQVLAGKYAIESVLGAGGMGVVVAATQTQLGRRVAIKFMRADAARDENAVSRFVREARSAVALTSEHAAKVIDVGTLDNGAPYMVMEYLAGVDLSQVLASKGRLPVADAVSYVVQACEALAEAHSLGIVHRDLKPSNLFLSQRMDGSELVKVLDFGISKAIEARTDQVVSLTATDTLMGSPLYMSPEQIRSAKSVDARSDVWSIGVVLYELLSGACPFLGETLGDTLVRIVAEPAPPILQRRPELPVELAAAIHGCLQRSLEERIPSVSVLAAMLVPFARADAALCAARIQRMAALSGGGHSVRSDALPAMRAPERPAETLSPLDQPWPKTTRSARAFWLPLALGFAVLVCGSLAFALWHASLTPSGEPSPSSQAAASSAPAPSALNPGRVEPVAAETAPQPQAPEVEPMPDSNSLPSQTAPLPPKLAERFAAAPKPKPNLAAQMHPRPAAPIATPAPASSVRAAQRTTDYDHF